MHFDTFIGIVIVLKVFRTFLFESLKHSGNLIVTPTLTFSNCILPTECIYGFCLILRIYSVYFRKQHKLIDLWDGDVLYFLCGRN
jgi:hypothetical protein